MNKLLVSTLLAATLLVLDVPEASAHSEMQGKHSTWVRNSHSRDYYERNAYTREHRRANRSKRMPRWLTREKTFRRWYRHTPLREYRFLTWNQLYDLYCWERDYFLRRRY